MSKAVSTLTAETWSAFDRAAALSARVVPAAPILFFGNLAAYGASPLRVLTVGLNPSLHEFPARSPFTRFPSLASGDRDPARYAAALSAYFQTAPYKRWFNALEPLLAGAGASYYDGSAPSTALHTDICSPVATDPTWSQLPRNTRTRLETAGGPLWHKLLKALRPHMVALSVARRHLGRIEFEPLTEWETIHTITQTGDGRPRSRPYRVRGRLHEVGGCRSLFIFGPAAQTPFGLLSSAQRREVGAITARRYRNDWR